MTTTDQWANRIEIRSESSDRIYTVAQRASGLQSGTWACSCPVFKAHKEVVDAMGNVYKAARAPVGVEVRTSCKHLRKMSLKGPLPADPTTDRRPTVRSSRRSFAEEAYDHYDPADGFGSADEWARQAERWAEGRSTYKGPQGERTDTGYRRPGGQRQERPQWGQRTHSGPYAGDLALMGLTRMPAHVNELKAALKRKVYEMHPDRGGADDHQARVAFTRMMDAYRRLLELF